MDKETRLEEQVREMIWALHPSLTGEDLASYDFGFGSVVELISMATHKACVEEREACAVVAEGEGHYMCEDAQDTAKGIADLIRARSEP